jgi:hypothetical protein
MDPKASTSLRKDNFPIIAFETSQMDGARWLGVISIIPLIM